jgi:hypothetical protein
MAVGILDFCLEIPKKLKKNKQSKTRESDFSQFITYAPPPFEAWWVSHPGVQSHAPCLDVETEWRPRLVYAGVLSPCVLLF